MKKNVWFHFAFFSFFSFFLLGADQQSYVPAIATIPDFGKLSEEQRFEARGAIQTSYIATINELLRRLEDLQSPAQGRVNVAFLLGQMRAKQACADLIDQIDLQPTVIQPATRIASWGAYPAQEALCNIGMPAVNVVLERIPKEDNAARQTLMCQVLATVEGSKVARIRLEDLANKLNGPERERVTKCLGLIQ